MALRCSLRASSPPDKRCLSLRHASEADHRGGRPASSAPRNCPSTACARCLVTFMDCGTPRRVVGVAGVGAAMADGALLRSVAVAAAWRGSGIGRALVDAGPRRRPCRWHQGRSISSRPPPSITSPVSASHAVGRDAVPASVRASAEFPEACPASAVVMRKVESSTATDGQECWMRYALISDIHANLPALEAVLADIASADDVGRDLPSRAIWSATPRGRTRSSALLARAGIAGVAGNYDSTVATDYKHCGCRYEDPRQEELSPPELRLDAGARVGRDEGVPRRRCRSASTCCRSAATWPGPRWSSGPRHADAEHASTGRRIAPTSSASRWRATPGCKAGDVIAFGHTHKPWHREVERHPFRQHGERRAAEGRRLAGRDTSLLDVGQAAAVDVEFVRVEYDVDARHERSATASCRTTSPTICEPAASRQPESARASTGSAHASPRRMLAEAMGTFFLVLIGPGAVDGRCASAEAQSVTSASPSPSPSW